MAVKPIPAPKLTKAMGFTLPKISIARPVTSAGAGRSSASSYGKLAKLAASKTSVPMSK